MTTNEKIYEESLSWLMKRKEGLSSKEEQDFFAWLENEENKKIYEKNEKTFFSFESLGDFDKTIIKNDVKKDKRVQKFKKLISPMAASIIFIMLCFYVFAYIQGNKSIYQKDFYTTNMRKTNIVLPDDSIIDLDVKTKISVDFYKNKRLVELKEGKAIFAVQKDKDRIFQIKSGKNQIQVIGTKFEVVKLNKNTTVNVIEGKVRVSHLNENNKIKNLRILTKEQSISVNQFGEVLDFSNKEIRNIANWKKGILKFQKASLQKVLEEFHRYHEYKVEFENYELSQLNISGVFTIDKFDDFLESLTEIYPVKIHKEKNKIKILQKN